MKKIEKKNIKRKVAVFDIDGTIFRSSLLIEITEALIFEKIFSTEVKDVYKQAYKKWSERKGSYEEYIMAVVDAFKQNIKGVKHDDFVRIANKVITANHNRVYRYTRDLVTELKNKNYYLLAISHSPQEIVTKFTKTLGFDKTYGLVYELGADEKFTGQALYEDKIFDKSKILKHVIEKEGLVLEGSVGVGDSEGDISFLKIAKTPICFNPNKKLYIIAKKNGWKIVIERKDMIYEL